MLILLFTEKSVRSIGSGDCSQSAAGEACLKYERDLQKLAVHVKPETLTTSSPVRIRVVSQNFDIQSGSVKLVGLSHPMPPVKFQLKKNGRPSELSGSEFFGICTEKEMIWRAYVTLVTDSEILTSQLTLKVLNE